MPRITGNDLGCLYFAWQHCVLSAVSFNKFLFLSYVLSITLQCLSSFLEAFQKISDIAETNNAGLRPFGIALRRYCLRQRCVESRLRSFNSQITECLVTPLSDRLDEWRRTANQMDRDCVKELRKAKSELQRAILEAEKCKKRLRRKVRACFFPFQRSMCC
ncbi:unnamed protein product [Taenia asiatica]|uniref:IMD domain-containing protein n=1 Tax=Taenia asiatica TaxID=60517 RepID=A0A0R3WGJ0_TAEAS|nr:unnamed protein product [Taenia asiatica]